MKVEIVSSKVIKPSTPTPNALREYKLSFFDQLSSQGYVGYTFFYPRNHSIDDNAERWCDQLENSLSKTLSCFYMVAGTWDKHRLSINCDDQGVEVTRALVHGDLPPNVESSPDTSLLDQFLPCHDILMRDVRRPVLAIQLNLFSCGGLGLGYQMLHSIGDALSEVMFFDHWSATNCCLGPLMINDSPRVVLPCFELVSQFPGREVLLGLNPYSPNANTTENTIVTKCIVYNSSFIAALKQEAAEGGGVGRPTKRPPPSKVVAITAHIWRTFIRVSETRNGHERPCMLSFSMNLRGIIPHIPPHSWGTLVSHPSAWSRVGDGGDDLSEFVHLLLDVIAKDKNEFARRNPEEVYYKLVDEFNGETGVKPLEEDLLPVTSLCRFGWYAAADFGWEKPSWISPSSKQVPMAILMDSRDGESVEVWLALNEQDMIEFQRRFLDDQSKLLQLRSGIGGGTSRWLQKIQQSRI